MTTSVQNLKNVLGSDAVPIAIGFLDAPPPGLERWQGGAVAAGCVFWEKAMSGQCFYTVPADHHNCAVGSHTHGFALPPERAHELTDTLGFMANSDYVAMAEVPAIPTLATPPAVVAYGALERASFKPDVVLVALRPAQAMLLYEAAIKANAGGAMMQALGRPACAVLPLTTSAGQASISLGCKGNRTFAGLADEQLYVSIPGEKWQAVVDTLLVAGHANAKMGDYYRARKERFAAS